MKKCFFVLFSLFLSFSAFAFTRVISPVGGTFANKQSLVLDVSDNAECFYSFSGSDPLTSGFVYDGPVLIDVEGPVTLKIVSVVDNVKREEIEIKYNVKAINPFDDSSKENLFIKDVVSQGYYSYSSESPIEIPESFSYYFGDEKKSSFLGKTLSLNSSNMLARYVLCNVSDGNNNWRFIIFISGNELGTFSRYSVPFEIVDWNTFIFNGDKLIWSIDDGEWSASKEPITLDRSVKHTVKWQSVAFAPGNPVQSFVIPPEPKLTLNYSDEKTANFGFEGDFRYRMKILSNGVEGGIDIDSGLFTQFVFDTFDGDSVESEAIFAFYCDGVYQGTKTSKYKIDRRPPNPPEFISNNENFYARSSVNLVLKSEPDAEIFYAVSKPLKVSEKEFSESSVDFDSVLAENFVPYNGEIFLDSDSKSAVFYKVKAYAVDSSQNKSNTSEYTVVIDEYNYYIDGNSSVANGDGSRNRPFNSFAQVIDIINNGRFSHFFVKGEIMLPEESVVISSNCEFSVIDNARFIIPANSALVLRSASFSASNLIFEKVKSDSNIENNNFFVLENGTVNLNDCEIIGLFSDNGTGFTCQNSVLNLTNTGITIQSDYYSCGISSVDSKINLKDCRVSSIAQTSVNFSVSEGSFDLLNCQCKVVADLGRIAELLRTKVTIVSNNFIGELDRKIKGAEPIWIDDISLMLENFNNMSEGF